MNRAHIPCPLLPKTGEGGTLVKKSAHAGSLRPEMGFAIPDLGFNPVCKRLEKAVVFETESPSAGRLAAGLTDRYFSAWESCIYYTTPEDIWYIILLIFKTIYRFYNQH